MKLLHTTFTGVDEKTDLEKLKVLSSTYSKVEWGILYSESPSGSLGFNRYPSQEWFRNHIKQLEAIKEETGCQFALHVCGKAVKTLLAQENEFLKQILPTFNRVQINFSYKEDYLPLLEKLLTSYPDIQFITQHNNANKEVFGKIQAANHNILFDMSGGRGIETTSWIAPLSSKYYGYAGGLGADNIQTQLTNISQAANNQPFWVDMEGKVRTEDLLDLDKCEQVLKQIQPLLNIGLKNKI